MTARERGAFLALYPLAEVELQAGTSRDAMSALLGARCDLAVITRELEPEERRAAVQGGIELEGYRFARDAVVMVVHPSNPLENVAIEDVRRIYRGEVTRWSDLGGTNTMVRPVFQGPRSDISEFFLQQIMGGEPVTARVEYAGSDSEAAAQVRGDPGAIAYVSLAAAREGKTLRLAPLTGLPYWKPDLEAVYKGAYPLTRFFNLYVRSRGPRLASGFVTFITSYEGQKLVRESGLVPTTVPVRFVRRSPMLSAHP